MQRRFIETRPGGPPDTREEPPEEQLDCPEPGQRTPTPREALALEAEGLLEQAAALFSQLGDRQVAPLLRALAQRRRDRDLLNRVELDLLFADAGPHAAKLATEKRMAVYARDQLAEALPDGSGLSKGADFAARYPAMASHRAAVALLAIVGAGRAGPVLPALVGSGRLRVIPPASKWAKIMSDELKKPRLSFFLRKASPPLGIEPRKLIAQRLIQRVAYTLGVRRASRFFSP